MEGFGTYLGAEVWADAGMLWAYAHSPNPPRVRHILPKHKRSISKTTMKTLLHRISRSGAFDAVSSDERGYLWRVLSGAETRRQEGLYGTLSTTPRPDDPRIQRDLRRSFPNETMRAALCTSEGTRMLHRVVTGALNIVDRTYCQGMNYLACMLLMHMGEEDACWVLVRMLEREHDGYGLGNLYDGSQPYLETCILLLHDLAQARVPDLYARIRPSPIFTALPAIYTEWITTLFAVSLPFEAAVRVWDLFFALGQEAILLVALTILELFQTQLIAASIETFAPILRSCLASVNPADVAQQALQLRVSDNFVGLEGYRAPTSWSDRLSGQCRFM